MNTWMQTIKFDDPFSPFLSHGGGSISYSELFVRIFVPVLQVTNSFLQTNSRIRMQVSIPILQNNSDPNRSRFAKLKFRRFFSLS